MYARELKNTGAYEPVQNGKEALNSQEYFYRQAYQQAAELPEAAPTVPDSPGKAPQLRSWLRSAFRRDNKSR